MAWNQETHIEAEQAVIGAMLIDPDCVRTVLLETDENDFYLTQNRIIFRAVRRLFQDGRPVDPLVIADMLHEYRKDEPWRSYLAGLMQMTVTSANCHEYTGIMREQAAFLRLDKLAVSLMDTLKTAVHPDDCRAAIADLTAAVNLTHKKNVFTTTDLWQAFANRAELESEKPPEYIRFGFPGIDDQTFPKRGNVVILGAEPDVGKTAFGLQAALHMSKTFRVGYFAIDTETEEIGNRTISATFHISYSNINNSSITDDEWDCFVEHSIYTSRNLRVIEAPGYDVLRIQADTIVYGFDVVFIDYVQQVLPENPRANRTEQMASVSRAIKNFARSTNTMVVELAQLTRPERDTTWRQPTMHSIKESGQFEQDADLMFMLYRPNPEEDPNQSEHRIIRIVKNKKGKSGEWPLFFDGDHQRFAVMLDG